MVQVAVNYRFNTTAEEQMGKITISMSLTEKEAKAIKKAFEEDSLRKSLFLEEEWEWNKEKSLDWWKRKERLNK
jgi:hypothetical protein